MTRIDGLLAERFCLSIELWPPRSEAAARHLDEALPRLLALAPAYASITYGAAGSTRERTHDLVVALHQTGRVVPMAHLTSAAHRRSELLEIVERYREAGIENILALRGDPPLDSDGSLPEGELRHAVELVELVRSVGSFCVAVAAHPEGHPDEPDRERDLDRLAVKLALADFAITQFFFSADDYLRLVEGLSRRGLDKPVIPGIMPITKLRTVERMAELSGAVVPPEVLERLAPVADDPEAVRAVGVEIATELGERLLKERVAGLHFYTMNEVGTTLEVCANLGLVPPSR